MRIKFSEEIELLKKLEMKNSTSKRGCSGNLMKASYGDGTSDPNLSLELDYPNKESECLVPRSQQNNIAYHHHSWQTIAITVG